MNREAIEERILKYINDEEIKYAVLINGAWGSGKTYLYDTYLAKAIAKVECGKNRRKTNVYISLYGISDIELLAKELYTNYILKVKHINEKAYKVTNGMASIISKFVSISTDFASINFNGIKDSFRKLINIKDMVICFDDLERCSIPINDLFGFINNLVEHCHCKVIILADEDNIGKMYANMNLEIKYISLLSGRKLFNEVDNEGKNTNINADDKMSIEQLKKLNEDVYSENYMYKSIKEKVIGCTFEYKPDLSAEIDNIIEKTVKDVNMRQYLIGKKENILEYIRIFRNDNIRIIQTWLVKLEEIYKIIEKDYSNSKHYEYIFDQFMIYSLRVACAVGKNKKLMNWNKGTEYSYAKINDGMIIEMEGYRFIDDQYLKSEIDKTRVHRAANYLDDICRQKEIEQQEFEKRFSHGEMYEKLEQWQIYEDDEIEDMIKELKREIEQDKYVPQSYQGIIKVLVILNYMKLCGEELEEISNMLLNKIENSKENIEIENFEYDFQNEELQKKFHYYYDPIYNFVVQSNRKDENIMINEILDQKDVNRFTEYCRENHRVFMKKESFVNYIDIEKFIAFLKECALKDVYQIMRTFDYIYNFENLSEYYENDVNALEELRNQICKIEWSSITRTRARDCFCNILNKIIMTIKNEDKV